MVYESYWVDLSWYLTEFLLVGFVMVYESYWVDFVWFMNLTGWICRGS